jgi:hypothetical protein
MQNFYGPGGRFNLQAKIEWEALRRNPEFRIDCDKVRSSKEKKNEIAEKWGLRELYDYNSPLWNPKEEAYPHLFTKKFSSVRVLYGAKLEGIIDKNGRVPVSGNLNLFEGHFLPLLIDLSFTKEVIEQEVSNMLDEYLLIVNKPKKAKPRQYRGRGPSLDIDLDEEPTSGPVTIFQVWDMKKREGKSPWKIAQELYPQLKGRSYHEHSEKYDTNARRLQKQIADAIKRAETIIDCVTPAR